MENNLTINNSLIQKGASLGNDENGAPLLQLWFKVLILTVYATTFVIGSIGNILICFVLITQKKKRLRGINLLTINLACSDLIVLFLYLPAEVYQIESERTWGLGYATCKVIYSLNSITVNASIGTLIFITRDRYVAVVKPMSIHKRTLGLIKRSIALIWFLSIFVTIPLFIVADMEGGYCTELWPNPGNGELYWTIIFILQFVLPLIYLAVTYGIIIYKLHTNFVPSESVNINNNNSRYSNTSSGGGRRLIQRKKQHKKMVKMSIVLVIAYVLCISPQHAIYFLSSHLYHMPSALYLFTLANYMMILNSALNPVIYGALNNEIKKGVQRLLLCRKIIPRRSTAILEGFRQSFTRLPKRSSAVSMNTSTSERVTLNCLSSPIKEESENFSQKLVSTKNENSMWI